LHYFVAEWRPEWCMDSKRDCTVDWHLGWQSRATSSGWRTRAPDVAAWAIGNRSTGSFWGAFDRRPQWSTVEHPQFPS